MLNQEEDARALTAFSSFCILHSSFCICRAHAAAAGGNAPPPVGRSRKGSNVPDERILNYASAPTEPPPKWHPAVVTTLGWVVTLSIAAPILAIVLYVVLFIAGGGLR